MKAIEIKQSNPDVQSAINSLEIVEKPIPKPKKGQVLIKIESAPCNPSDLLFLQGMYGVKKTFPAVPGWEGSGRVVASGGGLLAWFLQGKRVACAGQSDSDGTWAEYYVADAKNCVPIKDSISKDQAASLIINPLTAIGLVEKASEKKAKAIIQTAACSQVGKMVQTLARIKHIPVINIVRREDQKLELINAGEVSVLNSEDTDFEAHLKEISHKLKATIAFDAVGGTLTGAIFNAMPPQSTLLVYGALSEEACSGFSPLSLIFERKELHGFWLSTWLKSSSFFHTLKANKLVQQLIESKEFETKIRSPVGFSQWKEALLNYKQSMTKGKVTLHPDLLSD